MSVWIRVTVGVLALLAASLPARAQQVMSLDLYTCAQFLEDIETPRDGSSLLRSMMMISWAAGFTAAHQGGAPRGDVEAVRIVASILGGECRKDSKRTVIAAIANTIEHVTNPTSAPSTTDAKPPGAGPSRWRQAGSVLTLSANGPARKFNFDEPTSELVRLGVQKDSVLFEGRKDGRRYFGTAFGYAANCQPVPYEVTGDVSEDEKQITIRGREPRLDDQCKVSGHKDKVMTFTFLPAAN